MKDQYAYNPTGAKQLLAAAGYPNGFNTDVVADLAGDMDLLQVVKSYFAAVGINMEIRTMDSTSWASFVSASHKQDQLAMKSSGLLGFGYEPIRQLNEYHTGSSDNIGLVNDPTFDAFGTAALAATTVDGMKQIMIDANKYVAQQHFAISLLQPMTFSLYEPWLKGYNGQTQGISGGLGAHLIGFYCARFWIDTNLKKLMGY